ncbi:MAG: tRNA pseudouridine(13) synthase TruD [Planctomycetota bacterium]
MSEAEEEREEPEASEPEGAEPPDEPQDRERSNTRLPVPPELARGYLCGDLPAITGRVRETPEDFEVEELPLYEPSGEGEHLYLRIEKRGIPTLEAIRRISTRLNVPQKRIGYAGLKDSNALTRQTVSVQFARVEDAARIEDEQLRLLEARPHRNKLKVGHLRGNRFKLRLRGSGAHEAAARAVLERLSARGVANYFGLQRYGWERSTHLLGAALVAEDPARLVELLLLGPAGSALDHPRVLAAREAIRAGDHAEAARRYPSRCGAERAVCRALAEGKDAPAAARLIGRKERGLYISAFQSLLFNAYLTRRLERLDALEEGEVATLHRNGAAFVVTDAAADAPRCAAFEISPSGPIFGRKLLRPAEGSSARADEDAVLAEHAPGLGPELSAALGAKPEGGRRPLRIPLTSPEVTREGEDLLLAFELPKGCYATAVLEELFREQVD